MIRPLALLLLLALGTLLPAAETIVVDDAANRLAISPGVYGGSAASQAQVAEAKLTFNRAGGNASDTANWLINASNHASDWYFESIADGNSATAGASGDSFISGSVAGGGQPMITINIFDWMANLGSGRSILCSFSIQKYGAQTGNDWWIPDAGTGVLANGQNVSGNDPADAYVANSPTIQGNWVTHIKSTYSGQMYYILGNEHSIWQATHRDLKPVGANMAEIRDRMVSFATAIKTADPAALVVGPEEWGWDGYFYSGYDQQYMSPANGYATPDRDAHGGADYLPWLLDQMKAASTSAGKRLLDVFSVHYYPQGDASGNQEYNGNVGGASQAVRNRSTRSLWDPNYTQENWQANVQGGKIYLIPRLKQWVAAHYPGTRIALTEYSWGWNDADIGIATTQADILGILGREGCDIATRWTAAATGSVVSKSFQMYRNYDGASSTFGDTSVQATVANPDNVAAFAAERSSDGAMTVMLINKTTSAVNGDTVQLDHFTPAAAAQVWQLTSANAITHLADLAMSGSSVTVNLPAQSITLLVIARSGGSGAPTVATAAAANPITVTGTTTALSVLGADNGGEANLTYTWATTGSPPAAVTFSANGSNAAKNTTATFTKAGSYAFQVTIRDAGGLAVTSTVGVTVNQTLTTITVTPASPTVVVSATQQFTASGKDQFGATLTSQPSFTWSVAGGGTIVAGLFTAGTTLGGPYTVTATSGARSGTTAVTVAAALPADGGAASGGGGGGGGGGCGLGSGATGLVLVLVVPWLSRRRQRDPISAAR